MTVHMFVCIVIPECQQSHADSPSPSKLCAKGEMKKKKKGIVSEGGGKWMFFTTCLVVYYIQHVHMQV